ncbi:hypothetical protein P43SY_005801 [Pythium insidiosum]|uniref:Uncharacterized protein n=1 Tax=Pythium insidiosum TaxID=114742 RepID=A0AAD5LQR4_PYTIN|nr:hypothetical protein P43SY_005801 [Pythium insidiosum]
MDEFLHTYEMESLALGITARRDVVEQVRRWFGGDVDMPSSMQRTATALAARRRHEQDEKDAKDPDASELRRLVIAGNTKECFRQRMRNVQLVALCAAIVKSRLVCIGAIDVSHNHLGEEQPKDADAKAISDDDTTGDDACRLDVGPALGRLLQPTAMYTSAIKELDLSYNRLGAESCRLLCASLSENAASPLRRLSLSGNPLRVGGGHAIAALLASSSCRLEELQLGNTELEVENLIAIATALRSNRSLHTLNLDNPIVRTNEEEAIQHIGKMLQVNETLKALSLCKHQLTDHGAQVLAERLLDNQSLQSLALRANRIGATGASALAALLLRHDALTEFDLSANRIGDAGAEAFAKLLRHNSRPLATLALCSAYLTDDGLSAIAEACLRPRHPETNRLRSLLLWGNDFGERSAGLFLELHSGRFAEYDVETDFLPIQSDAHGTAHVAHQATRRARHLESPKR